MKNLIFIGLTTLAMAPLTSFAGAAQAFTFGTNGIRFDQDTTADFTFINSQGAFTSSLKVVEDLGSGAYKDLGFTLFSETKQSDNGSSNDWIGTCGAGKTVANCTNSFTFLKGTTYSFLLDSGSNGKVFSTNALNTLTNGVHLGSTPAGTQQAKFLGQADPFVAPVLIAFDDRGNGNDKDFNDFKISMVAKSAAPAPESVPEPGSLSGLGLTVGALVLARRRVASQSKSC